MGYYSGRRYRSWRSRTGNWSAPTKYALLTKMFGGAVIQIRQAFFDINEEAREELFSDYGAIYGKEAEKYARKTFPEWSGGGTDLSSQTMKRLVRLVPPYLSPEQRFSILQSVLKHNKKQIIKTININIKEPYKGFLELQDALQSMSSDDVLAHLPENVMKAALWLYDDDITVSRAMLAEAERTENYMIRMKAAQEIELLKRTISSGQVKVANYSVDMPAGKLRVVATVPSKCYVSTVCFGEDAPETLALREWRDKYLLANRYGVSFVAWYYKYGENLATITASSQVLKFIAKVGIGLFAKSVARMLDRSLK